MGAGTAAEASMALSRILVLALVLLSVLLCSCEPRIPRAVAAQDEPVRVLSVLLVLEEGVSIEQARQLIREANAVLIRQTGLALHPVAHITADFPSRKRNGMLQQMYASTLEVRDHFDLFIGFARKTPVDRMKRVLVGDWMGVIDDTYRRYIVLKEMDRRVLVHEVYHAFLESDGHSGCGLMSALVEILPGIPLNYSMRLCEEDRTEIIANRDRRFDATAWPPVRSAGKDKLAIR